jgi:hypothetical protein
VTAFQDLVLQSVGLCFGFILVLLKHDESTADCRN